MREMASVSNPCRNMARIWPRVVPLRELLGHHARQVDQDDHRLAAIAQLRHAERLATVLGMKVLLGVWIGRDSLKKGTNEKEIEIAVRMANDPANKDVIRAVVVGNEVLLRREEGGGAAERVLRAAERGLDGVEGNAANHE